MKKKEKDYGHRYSLALTLGVFMGALHLFWLILVALGIAKPLLDWILMLHHMKFAYSILPFDIVNAVLLVVFTFAVGYVLGWIISAIWGGCNCQKK